MAQTQSARSHTLLESMPKLSDEYTGAFKDMLPVLGTNRSATGDPTTAYEIKGVTIDPQNLNEYTTITRLPLSNVLPLTYPFVLTFPLTMKLMSAADFPFKAVGSIHLTNVIEQFSELGIGGTFDFRVHAQDLRPHPKGLLIDVIVQVLDSSTGELLWKQTSTYLHKGAKLGSGAPVELQKMLPSSGKIYEQFPAPQSDHPTGYIQVSKQRIKNYAEISGDKNPIHVSDLAAKAFGFPSTIAHGMWTAATMLRQVIDKSTTPMNSHIVYSVEFNQPVVLPAKTAYYAEPTGTDEAGAWDVSLRKASNPEKVHAVGTVKPA